MYIYFNYSKATKMEKKTKFMATFLYKKYVSI